jgi:hypothetical protein
VPLGIDDAIDAIVLHLRRSIEFPPHPGQPDTARRFGCDLWIHEVAQNSWRDMSAASFKPHEYAPTDVHAAFYDAAWYLCRIGVLRPGMALPRGAGTAAFSGDAFALTMTGMAWIKNFDRQSSFPLDPGRFNSIISQFQPRFGDGFAQRISEAYGCYRNGNNLACCAVVGAACESILLAMAIKKKGNADEALKLYLSAQGRRKVMDLIASLRRHI